MAGRDDEAATVAAKAKALLHACQPGAAAALLTTALQARGSVLAAAAIALRADAIRWSALPDLDGVAERCRLPATAIGIDLHWELGEADAWADLSFYPDGPEQLFTTSTQPELSALCEDRAAPWHGEFEEVRGVTVYGLGDLRRAANGLPRGDADRTLAAWLILARFFESAERHVIAPGLRRVRYVLLGSPAWEVAANAVYAPRRAEARPSPPPPPPQPNVSSADALARLRTLVDAEVGRTPPAAAALVTAAVLGIGLLNRLRR